MPRGRRERHERLQREKDRQAKIYHQKSEAFKSASDALKTRICYVSQVVIFLVALIGLTIGLTVGYNEDLGKL